MCKIISIDPGRKKSGIVIADIELGKILNGKVIKSSDLIDLLSIWQNNYKVELILLGNGTSSRDCESKIRKHTSIPILIMEEKDTTLRARVRYWELWPKNFILKLIPSGLIVPTQNLDAIAALIILEDYLGNKLKWIEKPDFKI